MAEDELKQQLRDLLAKIIVEEEVVVGFEDNLFQLGVLDSVLLIHFVSEIEKTFRIAVADREMIPDYFFRSSELASMCSRSWRSRTPPRPK